MHTVYRYLKILEKNKIISWKKGRHNKALPKVSIIDLQENRTKLQVSSNDISNDTSNDTSNASLNINSYKEITYKEEALPKSWFEFEEKCIKPIYHPYEIKRNEAGEFVIPGMKPGWTSDEKQAHWEKWTLKIREANRLRQLFNETQNERPGGGRRHTEAPGARRQFSGHEEQPIETIGTITKNMRNG